MSDPRLKLTIPHDQIEPLAWEQIKKVLKIPELVQLAIMPDVHTGYDLCIGGVALLDGLISPSFVGYDIGCGMCHSVVSQSPLAAKIIREQGQAIFNDLLAAIPTGVGCGCTDAQSLKVSGDMPDDFKSFYGLEAKIGDKLAAQYGSLGSGNHFIEVGINDRGHIGVTIHSGSRGPGHAVGEHYMRLGRMFPLNSAEGRAYFADMQYMLQYALGNRISMFQKICHVLERCLDGEMLDTGTIMKNLVNENHNHAVVNEDGTVLHRKGATPADMGQLGIIPANQRDGVYITRGLGNQEFLCSASHGAGRVMSRNKAKKQGTVVELENMMQGIVARTDKGVLDEAPWAYKNIDDVIKAQDGVLVDVIDHFKPLIVVKGALR